MAVLMLGLAACSSTKNPLPPPFKGSAVENPISCKTLQNGQIVGKEIHLDGGVPECAADGLRCPLPGVPAKTTSSVCGARAVAARCEQNRWALVCEAVPDASAAVDAGPRDAGKADGRGD